MCCSSNTAGAPSRPSVPEPDYWPGDELLGMGLPPTFEPSGQRSDGRAKPMGHASCHAVVVEDVGSGGGVDAAAPGPRVLLLAHAYCQKSCPGACVL